MNSNPILIGFTSTTKALKKKDGKVNLNAIDAIIGDRKDRMIKDCEDHALYAGKTISLFVALSYPPTAGRCLM
jgi:hypothetical protein